jgi:hypothetical protein
MQDIIGAIQAVQAIQTAKQRIPKKYKHLTYFSDLDQWRYFSIGDGKRCKYCDQHEGITFSGSEIRGIFPDLDIVSPTMIYPRVHMTLYKQGKFGAWSKDSCRCVLIRELREDPLAVTLKKGEEALARKNAIL